MDISATRSRYQGNVRELSGNFRVSGEWSPWINYNVLIVIYWRISSHTYYYLNIDGYSDPCKARSFSNDQLAIWCGAKLLTCVYIPDTCWRNFWCKFLYKVAQNRAIAENSARNHIIRASFMYISW